MDNQMQGLNNNVIMEPSSTSNPNLPGFPFPNHQSPMLELDYDHLDNFLSNGECNLGDNYIHTNASSSTNNNNNNNNVFINNNNNSMGKESELFEETLQNNDVYLDMPSDFSSYLDRLFADDDSIPQSLLNQESTVPVSNDKNNFNRNTMEKPANDDYSLNYVVSRGTQQEFSGSKNCDVVGGVTSCNNDMPSNNNNNSSSGNPNNYNCPSNVNIVPENPLVPVFKVPEPLVLPINDNNNNDNSNGRKNKKAKNGLVARKTNPICPTAPYNPRMDMGWAMRNNEAALLSSSAPYLLSSSTPPSPPNTTTGSSSSLLPSNQSFSGGLLGHYQALSARHVSMHRDIYNSSGPSHHESHSLTFCMEYHDGSEGVPIALTRSPYFPSPREREKFLGGGTTANIDDALLKKKWRYPSLGGGKTSTATAKTSITAPTASSSRFAASGSLPNASSWSQMDGNAGSSRTGVPHYGSTLFGGTQNDRPLFGNHNHMGSSSSSSSSWQDLLRPMSSSLLSRHDDIPLLTYELLNPPVDNTILFRITNEGDPSQGENCKWKITPYLNPNANKNKNTNSDLARSNISIGAKNTLHDVPVLPSTVPNPNAYFTHGMGVGMQQGQHQAVVGTNFNNQTGGSRLPETSYTPATNTSSWDDILAAATACLTGPGPALATPQMGSRQHFQAPPGHQGMESWQPHPHVQPENYGPGPQQFHAPPRNVAATVGQDRESWQPQAHVQMENYGPGPQQFQAPQGNVTATIGQDMESWQPQVQTENYGPGPQQFQAPPGNVATTGTTTSQDKESWQPQVQMQNYRPGPQQLQATPRNVTAAMGQQDRESWQPQAQTENYGPGPQQFQAQPGNVAATGATTSQDKESWQPQVHQENNGPGPMDTTDIDEFINFDAMMSYWPECDLDQYEKFGSDI